MIAILQAVFLSLGSLSLALLSLSCTKRQRERFRFLRRLDGKRLHAFLTGGCLLLVGGVTGVLKDALTPQPVYTIVSSLSQQSYPRPVEGAFERELHAAVSEIAHTAQQAYANGWTALKNEEFLPASAHFARSLQQVPTMAAHLGYSSALINLSRFNDAKEGYRQGLALAEKQDSLEYKEAFYAGLGHASERLGETEEAIRLYGIAMQLAKSSGDQRRQADLMTELGWAEAGRGRDIDKQAALSRLNQALHIFKKLGDQEGEARVLNSIALIRNQPNDVHLLQRALDIFQTANSLGGQADVKGNLGLAFLDTHQYDLSLQYQQQALALHQKTGNKLGEANDIHNIGLIYLRMDLPKAALEEFERSLKLHREVGSKINTSRDLYCMGEAYFRLHDFRKAEASYQESHSLAAAAGDLSSEPSLLINLTYVYVNTNRSFLALDAAQRAVDLVRKQGSRIEYAWALKTRGDVHAILRHTKDALQDYSEAGQLIRAAGDRRSEHKFFQGVGHTLEQTEEPELALKFYQGAYSLADSLSDWVLKVKDIQHVAVLNQRLKRKDDALNAWKTGYLVCVGASDTVGRAFFSKQIGLVLLSGKLEAEANQSLETSVALYESNGEIGAAAGVLRDWGNYLTGAKRYDAALAKYQKALEYVRRIPDPSGEARLTYNLGMSHSQLKDLTSAEADFRKAIVLAAQIRDEWTIALATNALAYTLKEQGDIAAGIRELNTALSHCRAAGDKDLSSSICLDIKESLKDFANQLANRTKSRR